MSNDCWQGNCSRLTAGLPDSPVTGPERTEPMRRNSGFTIVELLIVLEIIMIVVALAYPQIQRAFISANEGGAVGSLRIVAIGQASYKTAGFTDVDGNGEGDYGSLQQLGNPDASGATPPLLLIATLPREKKGDTSSTSPSLQVLRPPPRPMCVWPFPANPRRPATRCSISTRPT